MVDSKIKVNFNEGYFEIEGTESFIEKHWSELKTLFENKQIIFKHATQQKPKSGEKSSSKPVSANKKEKRKPMSLKPLDVDLKESGQKPSLKKFIDEKKPSGGQETITTVIYYLTKFCSIQDVELGHIVTCYNELHQKIPNIYSVCLNIMTRKGWIESGEAPYTHKINRLGENFVGHDLPIKPKSK